MQAVDPWQAWVRVWRQSHLLQRLAFPHVRAFALRQLTIEFRSMDVGKRGQLGIEDVYSMAINLHVAMAFEEVTRHFPRHVLPHLPTSFHM